MSLTLRALALAALTMPLLACGGGPSGPTLQPTMVRPKANFFLRTGFDTDPSVYLGRFVPDAVGDGDIDDANAQRTACSQFFTIRKVKGGGVTYDEYFRASESASAGLSLPADDVPIKAGISHQNGRVVRVQYTLTDKWIADLTDPAGYDACCRKADGNCSGRIVGEFLGGTGKLYYADMRATSADLKAAEMAGVEYRDGVAWRQAVEFKQPVFFAFKLSPANGGVGPGAGSAAADWAGGKVPKVGHGQYFVGVSEWVVSERLARDQALLEARRQVIRYLGEAIQQSATRNETLAGDLAALTARLEEKGTLQRASQGVASFVKDEDWKVESTQGPDGWQYKAKVLAFIATDTLEQAARAAADATR